MLWYTPASRLRWGGDAMKAFACGDVVPGCEARWVCSSEDEVLREVAAHARSAHGLTVLSNDLVAAVRAAVVTVS